LANTPFDTRLATRLIEFGRFAARDRKQRGEEKPETFTFLGFTHFCGKRQNGVVLVKFRNLSVGHDLTFGAGMGFQGKGGS
jgi:hypothetical protein